MQTGTVKHFNPDRQFGFLIPDGSNGDRSLDVYFGAKLLFGREVAAGDRVEFEATDGERGPRATSVTVL